ncbi:MAG: flavin reductase family protein [Pirellulales bacterium]|nr:flavin reductase family protein [Pirellulales bacterium]
MNNRGIHHFDDVFKLIDREIWIVTSASSDGRRGGLVATWVSQASIDPGRPVVVVGIAPNHFTAELIEGVGGFVAHLISADQIDLAWRFALKSGRNTDKFDGVPFTSTATGLPIVNGCIAWLECRVIAKYDAGDRWFYWGDVVSSTSTTGRQPLKERELFAAASAQQLAALAAGMQADAETLRSAADHWRAKLPCSTR